MLAKILDALETQNVFLTGGGGTGKSYLTKKIIQIYRSQGLGVIPLGSTGISAINIGGSSIHSFFCFGFSSDMEELKLFDRRPSQKEKLRELKKTIANIDLLVIDEISMVSADLLDMVWHRLNTSAFNGKILFVGDFYQLPPIKKKKENKDANLFSFKNYDYAFESNAWATFAPINFLLTVSKRTKNRYFFELLSRLRVGILDDEICEFLFSRMQKTPPTDTTMLFGINKTADLVNEQRLNELDSKEFICNARTQIKDLTLNDKTLDNWIKSINLPEDLKLKTGAKIMFTINKKGAFYNGEQGIIKEINATNCSIKIQKSNGDYVYLEPHTYELISYENKKDKIEEDIKASYTQFPLKLAYAITIHKSQGMSLENFVCNLDHIFARGQLYVALSRAINPESLFISYNRSGDFKKYLINKVKTDEAVNKFYNEFDFIKE